MPMRRARSKVCPCAARRFCELDSRSISIPTSSMSSSRWWSAERNCSRLAWEQPEMTSAGGRRHSADAATSCTPWQMRAKTSASRAAVRVALA
eukprot:scaffold93993_cov52-Phaeocystis_antarctica.AAC.2